MSLARSIRAMCSVASSASVTVDAADPIDDVARSQPGHLARPVGYHLGHERAGSELQVVYVDPLGQGLGRRGVAQRGTDIGGLGDRGAGAGVQGLALLPGNCGGRARHGGDEAPGHHPGVPGQHHPQYMPQIR